MTIGPEPSIRIFLMSVRFGIESSNRGQQGKKNYSHIAVILSSLGILTLSFVSERFHGVLVRRAQGGVERAEHAREHAEHERIKKPHRLHLKVHRGQSRDDEFAYHRERETGQHPERAYHQGLFFDLARYPEL